MGRSQLWYGTRLNEEVESTSKTIENAIKGNLSLSDEGKVICINALSVSCSIIELLICYIDATYRELRRSKLTKKRAWHLVSSLCCRIFTYVFAPGAGKIGIIESKNPNKVATTVCHVFLSLEVMRESEDQGFTKHPSIALEHIKFICHNYPLETLELNDARINGIEGSIKDINRKITTKKNQLNIAT